MLEKVPSDVTVIASDFLTAHLPQVKDMYVYPYDDAICRITISYSLVI